ncbi:hypothetical protein, partial [Raoultella terrigena]|uniref:hypothetical protein n=1 Tax=Raoultella terrigena TaxID=577 RepID=UPI00384F3C42
ATKSGSHTRWPSHLPPPHAAAAPIKTIFIIRFYFSARELHLDNDKINNNNSYYFMTKIDTFAFSRGGVQEYQAA